MYQEFKGRNAVSCETTSLKPDRVWSESCIGSNQMQTREIHGKVHSIQVCSRNNRNRRATISTRCKCHANVSEKVFRALLIVLETAFKMHFYIHSEIGHGEVLDQVQDGAHCAAIVFCIFMDYCFNCLNLNLTTVRRSYGCAWQCSM